MIVTTSITSKKQPRDFMARVCCFILAVVFLLGQTLSSSHAHDHVHDHSHDTPSQQTCEVCIVAAKDDLDVEQLADKSSDVDETKVFWFASETSLKAEPRPASKSVYVLHATDPPPVLSFGLDPARAPPV